MNSWTAYQKTQEKETISLVHLMQKIEKSKGKKRAALLAELKSRTESYEYDYLVSYLK